MPKKLSLQSSFEIEKNQGRPLLRWDGKKPLERIAYFPSQEKERYGDPNATDFNSIFWGDNLQVLAHLLKNYRGAINLIYIDPPFGTGVDYFKKIRVRGELLHGNYSLFEEKQYANVFEIDYFLQFMYERLVLMKELLADDGKIFIRFDYHFLHYIKALADEIFGIENFLNEIIVKRSRNEAGTTNRLETTTESILLYQKTGLASLNKIQIKRSIANIQWTDFQMAGDRNPPQRVFLGKTIFPPKGQHFSLVQEKVDRIMRENYLRLTCRNCKAVYFEAESDEVLFKSMKKQPNRFKFYDITNDVIVHGVKTIDKCLECGHPDFRVQYLGSEEATVGNNWSDIASYATTTGYPTENSEALLERVIQIGSKEGDLIADFFAGSGTTAAVAQQLGRRWITCDINQGSIQTTVKRLMAVLDDKKSAVSSATPKAFKVLNVNDYDIFKNELESKDIILEMYGVEKSRTKYFDGLLDNSFVKVMPINRVCSKKDVDDVLKGVRDNLGGFTAKSKSRHGESVYQEGVTVFCSGLEMDMIDYIKKNNDTGVEIDVRDILLDKQTLIFKQKPEAEITVKGAGKKATIKVEDFISPILMRKLEIENEKTNKRESKAKVEDYRQVIDSVAIDIDYDGDLFNAEIIDVPSKNELIKGEYVFEYPKAGKKTLAVKIVDVLGEEYFETFEITV